MLPKIRMPMPVPAARSAPRARRECPAHADVPEAPEVGRRCRVGVRLDDRAARATETLPENRATHAHHGRALRSHFGSSDGAAGGGTARRGARSGRRFVVAAGDRWSRPQRGAPRHRRSDARGRPLLRSRDTVLLRATLAASEAHRPALAAAHSGHEWRAGRLVPRRAGGGNRERVTFLPGTQSRASEVRAVGRARPRAACAVLLLVIDGLTVVRHEGDPGCVKM